IFRCDGEPIEWPEKTNGPGTANPQYRTAASFIDFSLPCPSIFLTKRQGKKLGVKRPLAVNTRKRIARGIWKFVINSAKAFIVPVTHPRDQRVHSVDEPLRTITNAHRGELALVAPMLSPYYGEAREGQVRGHSVEDPLPTQTAEPRFALVAPLLAKVKS